MARVTRRKLLIGVATTDWSRTFRNHRGGMALGGSGWIRFGQIAPHSRHRVVIGNLVKSGRRLGVASWDSSTVTCDIIFMQRHMESSVFEKVRNAVDSGQIIVNDVDDWYWNLHPDNQASRAVDPSRNASSNINHYLETIKVSTAVTVSTPFLAEKLQALGISTTQIQNGVEVSMFASHRHNRTAPVIGWAGSTAHRSGDLEILKEFSGKLPAQYWHHLGHNNASPIFHEEIGVPQERVSTTPMLPPWDYARAFSFDVGLVPLSDHEFNRAKSWIKGLEYTAAGIPFIASPSEEYLRLKEEYGIGRIAETPEEWVEHIKSMSDAKRREQEAEHALKIVSNELDARSQAKAFDKFIDELTS